MSTRALVTTCKNCKSLLALLVDVPDGAQVRFEDPDVPRKIKCAQCHFTYEYPTSEFRWAHIRQADIGLSH
jgi:RNase P subunit RPR2